MACNQQESSRRKFFNFRIECQSKIFNGYRVGLIVSVFYSYFLLNQKPGIRLLASAIKKFITTPVLLGLKRNRDIAMYYSIPRNDYLQIMDFVRDEFHGNGISIEEASLLSLKGRMSTLGEILNCFAPALKLALSHRGSLLERLFFFTSYCYLLKGFTVLERSYLSVPEKAVFFNSSNFPESMLCEFLGTQGVKTFSMQHGMYLRLHQLPYDIINYSNVIAHTLLCWGEITKYEVERFYQENSLRMDFCCEVAGYPRHSAGYGKNKIITTDVLVLLPRLLYRKESIKLLKLIKKISCDIQLVIKPHPSLFGDAQLESLYSDLGAAVVTGMLSECLGANKYKAIIGFNSTSIFEAIPNACEVFLYSSGRDEFPIIDFKYFASSYELTTLLLTCDGCELEESKLKYECYFGKERRNYFELINR